MRTIWSFVRLDLSTQRQGLRRMALAVIVFVVMFSLLSTDLTAVAMAVAVLPLMLPMLFFAEDQRSHLDTLYGALPLTRRQVVTGRYASLMLWSLGAATLGPVVAIAVAQVQGRPPSAGALVAGDLTAWSAAWIVLSLQLPAYFRWGYAKAGTIIQIATFALFFAAVPAIRWAAPSLATLLSPGSAPAGISLAAMWIPPAAALGAAALSRWGAGRFYARREL